jgi:OmcA/MtrC family decaheme c-type cytochrome
MMRNSQFFRIGAVLGSLLFVLVVGACGDDGNNGNAGADGAAGSKGDPGDQGDPGPAGVLDDGTSIEACVGCHGAGQVLPVASISAAGDAHEIDTDPLGPASGSGYRQLNVTITTVDVSGGNIVILFDVEDENTDSVDDIFAGDGRFTIAKLIAPMNPGDSNRWQSLIEQLEDPGSVGDGPGTPELQATYERFTESGGSFQNLGVGAYSYTSAFDPSTGNNPVAGGESMRLAIQLSSGDLPAGNGWCDFNSNLAGVSNCVPMANQTRDIVQTVTCNGCHGVTTDTKLALHGGGRTDVEYCVTCHNPGSKDANSGNSVDFTIMIHKIHYGSNLANGYKIWGFRDSLHDYSDVNFTKEADDCTGCHTGGGADEGNWSSVPTQEACGSCHDDVNFDTGANHGTGIVVPGNEFCTQCHPATNFPTAVEDVHHGVVRKAEADLYTGAGNGFVLNDVVLDAGAGTLTIQYSVVRGGVPMDLANDDEWTAGGASRLAITVGWESPDYTNDGSGSTPALPISLNGLDVGGTVTDNLDGTYTIVAALPSSASGTATVAMEGHAAADLDGDTVFSDNIAVINPLMYVNVDGGRGVPAARSDVINIAKCNACHDYGGQGLSLHGNNRTGEMQVCVVCHNSNATDINRRPADPTQTADGKVEEAIDMKRLVHQIHSGSELEDGIVVWGFGFPGTEHDFSDVDFIGNRKNCETCHDPGTYSTEQAGARLASTIDTGADVGDSEDDLNISPTSAVCSSCHDDSLAKDHMVLFGASFIAQEADIR